MGLMPKAEKVKVSDTSFLSINSSMLSKEI